jgi:hypothetical protein
MSITFKANIVDKELSNKQHDNMVYCKAKGCSSYFYKIEGSNHETCFHCRRK